MAQSYISGLSRSVGVTQQMGILDSLGSLVNSIITAIVMLVFVILSFVVTVFIVNIGARLASVRSQEGGFVVLAAAILAGAAIAPPYTLYSRVLTCPDDHAVKRLNSCLMMETGIEIW